jgi:hypothetical protein
VLKARVVELGDVCLPDGGGTATPAVSLARLASASSKYAGAMWAAAPIEFFGCHVAPMEFLASTRLRLGEPLPQVDETTCRHCKAPADAFGHHSLACMRSGNKTRVHSAISRLTADMARGAALFPKSESRPFVVNAGKPGKEKPSGQRCDIEFYRFPGTHDRVVVDFSVVSPVCPTNMRLRTSPDDVVSCIAAREAAKRREYDKITPRGVSFRPIVLDSFGAMSHSARAFFCTVACAWGNQLGYPPCRAIPLFMQRLSVTLHRALGAAAVSDIAPHMPPFLMPDAAYAPGA